MACLDLLLVCLGVLFTGLLVVGDAYYVMVCWLIGWWLRLLFIICIIVIGLLMCVVLCLLLNNSVA